MNVGSVTRGGHVYQTQTLYSGIPAMAHKVQYVSQRGLMGK